MAYERFDDLHDIREALAGVGRRAVRTIGASPSSRSPQPYDFLASTERFRSYGADRANAWHDGGLHRVIAGREVRLVAAPGGVEVEPADDDDRSARRRGCSGRRSTSRASGLGGGRAGAGRAAEPLRAIPAAARPGSVGDARRR